MILADCPILAVFHASL